MTKYTFATLDSWTRKMQRRQDAVVKQATNDVIKQAARTAPGKMRGGSVRPGFVPRHKGILANSLVSSLNGSTALQGETSYEMVVLGIEAGDWAEFGWTAPYARKMHYKGWLWVEMAANDWPMIVRRAVNRAKAQTR